MNRLQLQNLFETNNEALKNCLSNKKTRIISNRRIKRKIFNFEESLKLLDNEIRSGKITEEAKKKILGLIDDIRLKEYMSDFIEEFNNHRMDYLCGWMCDRIRDDFTDYRKTLNKYHIYETNFSEQIVFKYGVEELDGLLDKLIFKYGINKRAAYRTLLYSNLNRVYHVLDLLDKYSFEFDSTFDIDLFVFKMCDFNSDVCDNFECNITYLSFLGINPLLDYYAVSRLVCDRRIITDNVLILSSYGLFNEAKEIGDVNLFILLTSNNLEKKLDDILEAGCYDFVKNDLLSLSKDNTKRLQVLKCIDTPVVDQESYNITMSTNHFILDDNEIESEIYSAVDGSNIKLNISLDDLECFKLEDNKLLYSIGGVLVSVNKVKRLLDEGNDIYTSITSGLILTDDEYNCMMDILQPLQYKKN